MNRGFQVDGDFKAAMMKREVIQDFLNVPGIQGIALMDGITPPYCYGLDNFLTAEQPLIPDLQQVVETIPSDYPCFEFHYSLYSVYLHRFDRGLILLVLADRSLARATYTAAVQRLQGALRPLSQLTGLQQSETTMATMMATQSAVPSAAQAQPVVLLNEFLAAMNHLSQFTTRYLGTMVVANAWAASRPDVEWLLSIQIARSGQLQLEDSRIAESHILTPEQLQWLQTWVVCFIERCSEVIRDFAQLAESALSDSQQALLFAKGASTDMP